MKNEIFEIWAEMLEDPDYRRNDFINEAMEHTGYHIQPDWKDKQVMINNWFDEFRKP